MDQMIAIPTSIGSAIIAAVVTWMKMKTASAKQQQRKCDECPAHQALEDRINRIEVQTAADIAAIKENNRNICRSLDELRADVRELRDQLMETRK